MSNPPDIATRLRHRARLHPDKPAVIRVRAGRAGRVAGDDRVTFAQLVRDMDVLADGLKRRGLAPGDKTLFLVRPGIDFFAGFFALLNLGAVPVLIDPGMGRARMLECVRDVEPTALVGIPAAHLATRLWPRSFGALRFRATVGRRLLPGGGGPTFDELRRAAPAPDAVPAIGLSENSGDALAAILFTTGSTGPAKGVEYTAAMLARQIDRLDHALALREDDIDCATFPGFSLFSVALGMTAVVPDMNPTRPGFVNPDHILDVIQRYGCTFSFGSPALWRRVTTRALDLGVKLPPTLRRVVMAGAPAPEELHQRLLGSLLPPGGETFSPYGATEAMPVALIPGSVALAETYALTREGRGTCLGPPVAGVTAAVIRLTDDSLPEWSEALRVETGTIGEIVVAGGNVTRHYHHRPDADARAKITERLSDGGERVWHRMGDAGYFDEKGRLWFCGRVAHRVDAADGERYFSVCCEALFNRHPAVVRSALVGLGAGPGRPKQGTGAPGLVVELRSGERPTKALREELLGWGASFGMTRAIRRILPYPGWFPTDIRHNAKINRERLAEWANRQRTERWR